MAVAQLTACLDSLAVVGNGATDTPAVFAEVAALLREPWADDLGTVAPCVRTWVNMAAFMLSNEPPTESTAELVADALGTALGTALSPGAPACTECKRAGQCPDA